MSERKRGEASQISLLAHRGEDAVVAASLCFTVDICQIIAESREQRKTKLIHTFTLAREKISQVQCTVASSCMISTHRFFLGTSAQWVQVI